MTPGAVRSDVQVMASYTLLILTTLKVSFTPLDNIVQASPMTMKQRCGGATSNALLSNDFLSNAAKVAFL